MSLGCYNKKISRSFLLRVERRNQKQIEVENLLEFKLKVLD